MNRIKVALAAGAVAVSMVTGGVIGAALWGTSAVAASAATTATTLAASASPAPAGGAFRPNEDATHEAGESAAREAQEDAGQVPTIP